MKLQRICFMSAVILVLSMKYYLGAQILPDIRKSAQNNEEIQSAKPGCEFIMPKVVPGDALAVCMDQFKRDAIAFLELLASYKIWRNLGLTDGTGRGAYLYPAPIDPQVFEELRQQARELKVRSEALHKRLVEMRTESFENQGTELKIGESQQFIENFWRTLLQTGLIEAI